ncbi:hypothetical protein BC943DRAFT_177898 [Umbelopsis sp. AD052]|nr:hypothetical protein BC943DRAFT_177898 [Umbelopsis sp. AD052]
MHIFKHRVENVLGNTITPFEGLEPPSPLTTVRYTEQDYRNLLNQAERSSMKAYADGSQNTAVKNNKAGVVDIASWIYGRAPISDFQLLDHFTGQPLPTSNSYVDPGTIPFVNFTQLSEHHSHGRFTKPLITSPKNPDELNLASRHATASLMVTDDAVPDDHYDVTSSSTEHSLVTSTNNPSPTAPRTTCDIVDLASTPPNSVIHNNDDGNHPAVEVMEDVMSEILDEAPHFVPRVSHKPIYQSVDSSVINDGYHMQTKETPLGPGDEKATIDMSDKFKDLGDIVRSISEDREDDSSEMSMDMDVNELLEPVSSSEPTDDNVIQRTLHTANRSDEVKVHELGNSTVHIEQDRMEEISGTSVLIDHHKLQVVANGSVGTVESADANEMQDPATNEADSSQQPMESEECIPEGKQHDPAITAEINVENRALETKQLVQDGIHQHTPISTESTKSIDIDISDNHPVMVDDNISNERLSSVNYTHGNDNATESTTESTTWLYRSTDIEVLEPATMNSKHSSMEKENGHIDPKQVCLDPQHISAVRPNAWGIWEDQSEPSDSDIHAIKELVPIRKIQKAMTDEEYSRRLKLLKLEYETKEASIDEEEREAIEKIRFDIDYKREAMVEAYEREIRLLQSAWEARSDRMG